MCGKHTEGSLYCGEACRVADKSTPTMMDQPTRAPVPYTGWPFKRRHASSTDQASYTTQVFLHKTSHDMPPATPKSPTLPIPGIAKASSTTTKTKATDTPTPAKIPVGTQRAGLSPPTGRLSVTFATARPPGASDGHDKVTFSISDRPNARPDRRAPGPLVKRVKNCRHLPGLAVARAPGPPPMTRLCQATGGLRPPVAVPRPDMTQKHTAPVSTPGPEQATTAAARDAPRTPQAHASTHALTKKKEMFVFR